MAYDDRDDDDVDDLDIRRREGGQGSVPNYLTQAILVTLCCCVPLGIVAIVQASKVNSLLAKGQYGEAARVSARAASGTVLAVPATATLARNLRRFTPSCAGRLGEGRIFMGFLS